MTAISNDAVKKVVQQPNDEKCTELLFRQKTNLADKRVLQLHLGEEFQADRFVDAAVQVAKKVYEVPRRCIQGSSNCGLVFPMDAEVLGYAMKIARRETVLEMAGASGENAALLAFAGARQVFMNELEPQEMRRFLTLRDQLPEAVQKRLEAIEGNCLDILKVKPELKGKFGLVLCRNLIHFFNNRDQAAFFQQLDQLLKPDGKAIITVNSKYIYPQQRKVFDENPNANSFCQTQCLVTDRDVSRAPKEMIFHDLTPCSGDLISAEFDTKYIYERNPGQKWGKVDDFNQIDKRLQPLLQAAIKSQIDTFKTIKNGTVRAVTTHIRLYSKEDLIKLFKGHGFEVEFCFATGTNGHLVSDDDLYGKAQQCGVIVKRIKDV